MTNLVEFNTALASYANIASIAGLFLSIIGIIISFLTLITALRFRCRLRVDHERRKFNESKEKIIKQIRSYVPSMKDNIKSLDFLLSVDTYLTSIVTDYSFWGIRLKLNISALKGKITGEYQALLKAGDFSYLHDMEIRLERIAVLIGKE